MYVCVCQAVTETQVREAVAQGAQSLRDLRRELGVTAQCGRCAHCAHGILKECLSRRAHDPEALACAAA